MLAVRKIKWLKVRNLLDIFLLIVVGDFDVPAVGLEIDGLLLSKAFVIH